MVYAVIVPKSTEGFDTEKGVSCPPARAVHPAKDLVGGQVRTLKCPEFELFEHLMEIIPLRCHFSAQPHYIIGRMRIQ